MTVFQSIFKVVSNLIESIICGCLDLSFMLFQIIITSVAFLVLSVMQVVGEPSEACYEASIFVVTIETNTTV
jgi:hypothetical protein